jgi:hypothetical protein
MPKLPEEIRQEIIWQEALFDWNMRLQSVHLELLCRVQPSEPPIAYDCHLRVPRAGWLRYDFQFRNWRRSHGSKLEWGLDTKLSGCFLTRTYTFYRGDDEITVYMPNAGFSPRIKRVRDTLVSYRCIVLSAFL